MPLNFHTDLPIDDRTLVMGIVNITPDSFSDGGRYYHPKDAVARGIRLAEEGADILDLGAESTRPGAGLVDAEDEINRLKPVLQELLERVDVPISIDTTKAKVAREMLELGAHIINDISGLQFDPEMSRVVAEAGCPVCIMHIQGTPRTMQQHPEYGDIISDIKSYFIQRIEYAHKSGIRDEQIILDPGIGFGKTVEHNYRIIRDLREFTSLGYPILLGASRKSFIGNTLQLEVGERLEGSLAATVIGAWNGTSIVRVHDVRETVRALRLTDAIRGRQGALV